MEKGNLRFGVIVDLQGALELALGGGSGGGLDFNRINPMKVVEAAVERHKVRPFAGCASWSDYFRKTRAPTTAEARAATSTAPAMMSLTRP